ncbi:hypothetical protein BS17DRAFT_857519 [Gyrodon lividus]|nr:hypothetical protein BS17DRAFT_857519 [Gyrodon lividus]
MDMLPAQASSVPCEHTFSSSKETCDVLFDGIISPPSYLRHSRSLSSSTNRRVFHLPRISLKNHRTIVLVENCQSLQLLSSRS